MNLLAELDDVSLGLGGPGRGDAGDYTERRAARIILFNPRGDIAMLHAVNYGYHKLPGGGIEPGESWQDAAVREALEETGFHVRLREMEIGKIVEWRGRAETWRRGTPKLKQISTCGVADTLDAASADLTDEEVRVGLTLQWMSLDEAIELCNEDEPLQDRDQPDNYEGRFIKTRDLLFLKKAKTLLG